MISVNLSGKHFAHPELVEQIKRILGETGLNPALLETGNNRKRGDGKRRNGDRDAQTDQGDRRPALDRRFRNGLFEPELPAPFPDRHAQGRPLVCQLDGRRNGKRRDRPHGHRAGKSLESETWSPKGSKAFTSFTSCEFWAANTGRDIFSRARCRSPRSKKCWKTKRAGKIFFPTTNPALSHANRRIPASKISKIKDE